LRKAEVEPKTGEETEGKCTTTVFSQSLLEEAKGVEEAPPFGQLQALSNGFCHIFFPTNKKTARTIISFEHLPRFSKAKAGCSAKLIEGGKKLITRKPNSF
jgi:hypothetical protein